jgi:hypothetical protein
MPLRLPATGIPSIKNEVSLIGIVPICKTQFDSVLLDRPRGFALGASGQSGSLNGRFSPEPPIEEVAMASMDEQVLRTAKEIIVKFIETGRVSPAGFPDAFRNIYDTVSDAVRSRIPEDKDAIDPPS